MGAFPSCLYPANERRKTGLRVGSVTRDDDGLENLDEFFAEGLDKDSGRGTNLFDGGMGSAPHSHHSYNDSTMDIVNSEQVSPRVMMGRRTHHSSQPNSQHSNSSRRSITHQQPRHSLLTSRLLQDADSGNDRLYDDIPPSQPLHPPRKDRDRARNRKREEEEQHEQEILRQRRERVRRMEQDRIIQQQDEEERAAQEERREEEKARRRSLHQMRGLGGSGSAGSKKDSAAKNAKSGNAAAKNNTNATKKKDEETATNKKDSSKKRKSDTNDDARKQHKDRRTSGEKIRERKPTPMEPSGEDEDREYIDRMRRHSKGKRRQNDDEVHKQSEQYEQPDQNTYDQPEQYEEPDQYEQYSPPPSRSPININDGDDDDSIILDQEYEPEPEPEPEYNNAHGNGVDKVPESDSGALFEVEKRRERNAQLDSNKRRQNGSTKAIARANMYTSKDADADADTLRRSSRPRHRPLAEWALERTDFAGNIIAPPPAPTSTAQSAQDRKKRAAQGVVKRNKAKEIELHRTLEKYTNTAYPVKDDSGKSVKRDIAYKEKKLSVGKLNKDYEFKKIFQEPEHMASGVMVIDSGKEKPYKESNDNCYVFYVIDGAARVGLNQKHEFNISLGGSFYIPRMNQYKIRNIGNCHLKLFFTQIRIPEPVDYTSYARNERRYEPPRQDSEQESDESDVDAGSAVNRSPLSSASPASSASPTSSQSPPPRKLAYLSD